MSQIAKYKGDLGMKDWEIELAFFGGICGDNKRGMILYVSVWPKRDPEKVKEFMLQEARKCGINIKEIRIV